MTTIIQITIAAALILSILVPFGAFLLGEKNKKRSEANLQSASNKPQAPCACAMKKAPE